MSPAFAVCPVLDNRRQYLYPLLNDAVVMLFDPALRIPIVLALRQDTDDNALAQSGRFVLSTSPRVAKFQVKALG